jgi:hypothetical protein
MFGGHASVASICWILALDAGQMLICVLARISRTIILATVLKALTKPQVELARAGHCGTSNNCERNQGVKVLL